ncbi:MAG: haloacid dehalogenase, type II [Chloroflexi bacterium GWC2_73_18]|nr:MAG: haloacid dehalogenase, type II [Chloroflexi bacterium GWC2_73_18]
MEPAAGHRNALAVAFDLYGTLLDLAPLAAVCDRLAPGRGAELSARWRARQLEYSWLRAAMGTWADFWQVTAEALAAVCAELGIATDGPALAAVRDAWLRLPPRDGVAEALEALAASRRPLLVLSNATTRMLGASLQAAGLGRWFDQLLSTDAVRTFKPAPAVYALAADALRLPPERIGFVTANAWDAAGATAFGFSVAWLRPTPGSPFPRLGVPTPVATDWADIPRLFGTE